MSACDYPGCGNPSRRVELVTGRETDACLVHECLFHVRRLVEAGPLVIRPAEMSPEDFAAWLERDREDEFDTVARWFHNERADYTAE